jgi:hypothetical protein
LFIHAEINSHFLVTKKKEFAREVEFMVVPKKRGGNTVKACPVIRPPSPVKQSQRSEDPPLPSTSFLEEEEPLKKRHRNKSGKVDTTVICST